jgi:class 3 adenylate cyclase/tetratricopeptide (TPR) repeat protein
VTPPDRRERVVETQPKIVCPSCRHGNRPGRRFCARCGSRLGEVCAACGTLNEIDEQFCGHCGALLTGKAAEGERRQLTILFCDLVGSTAIAGQLDPEDWREVVAQYQRAAAEAVTRFGGYVARYVGDGLLVYFGYPQAHEDDPERAVRAGIALLDAVAELNRQLEAARGVRLAVRVGMHTGPAVIGEGAAGAEVFGDTPNIAARVQTLAEPDTVFVTEATHRLVSGRFVVEAKGAPPLKGVRASIAVYRVVQPSVVRSRFEAASLLGLTPFVGREAERRLLAERWAQARAGEGQVVLIAGEAGIGKSRLVRTFKETLAGEPHTWIECSGSPYHQNTPFYAVVDMLQQGLAWRGDEAVTERVGALEQSLALAGVAPPEAVPLLAPLLGLPVPERYSPLGLSPEAQRRRTFSTLVAWLFGAARVQPVVLVVEDLHWTDPSTLELQGLLAEQVATAPVLILYTAREEFRAPWPLLAHHAQVTLNRLSARQVREIVGHLAGETTLSNEAIETLVARTDGVPLFVEELTRALMESDGGAARTVPGSLHDSLIARLDRLGAAKEVAQVGAVLGREFSYALLHAVSPLPEAELQAALARLADAELLYPRGLPPEATYVFKHALVRDTAYASLLKSCRRELHGAIARVLAERFHDTAETQPELLAVHYTEAGEAEPAVAAWQRAGERALGRGALGEAVSDFRRGLAVLATLPESPAREEREFQLQLPLGQALMVTKGYGLPEIVEAFARARVLSAKLGEPAEVVVILQGLTVSVMCRDGPQAAQPLADQALAAAEQANRPSLQVLAHFTQALTRFYAGDLAGAREHCGRALALSDEATHLPARPPRAGRRTLKVLDNRIATLPLAALTAWHLGRAAEARGHAQAGVELAERATRPAERAYAEGYAAQLHILLREPAAAREHAERALAACAEEPNPFEESRAVMIRGWALAAEGQMEEGLAAVRDGFERFIATEGRPQFEFLLCLLADAHACAGNVAEALAVLADAEGAVPGEGVWRADTLRRRAELLARAGADTATVEATFRDALTVARRQGAKAYELRAGTRYGLFLRAHGRAAEARDLLAPIYGWFTEGFDTRDLVEAKALLEELG